MKFLILISTIFVMSCSNYTEDLSQAYELPEELKDCKVYWIAGKSLNGFKAMRCPLSSTSVSYSSGKHTVTTITTEDSIKKSETEELQKQLLEIQSKLNEIKSR